MENIVQSWSGGKDSAMALYELRRSGVYNVVALLTTVTEGYDRISMHGVRKNLLVKQAQSIGVPLSVMYISQNSSDEDYESRMREKLLEYKNMGVNSVAIGDIFLEDLREYREKNLAKLDMTGIFPLWKRNTGQLAERFIELGFKAVITCVDSQRLDGEFAGREYDHRLLSDLPPDVDPCGENGEFHSFVYAGPIFEKKIEFEKGETVLRENRFYFCDLFD